MKIQMTDENSFQENINDIEPGYMDRNRRWLRPLMLSFIMLSMLVLPELMGADLPILIPKWIFLAGLIIGGVSFGYGVITTNTVSALIVGSLFVAIFLAATIYFIISSLRVI